MTQFRQVQWEGALDMSTVPGFVSMVQELLQLGSVAVDLSKVEFIDSTGVAGLLNLRQAAQTQGVELRLVQVHPEVLEILDIMGVADLFASA